MLFVILKFASFIVFFFLAEGGIRDLVRSRGLGEVCKRQTKHPIQQLRQLFLIDLCLPTKPM